MKWINKVAAALISLLIGFFSFDYLLFSFKLLTSVDKEKMEILQVLKQLGGGMLFIVYFFLIGYIYFKYPKKKWSTKLVESIIFVLILVTGLIIRWGYIIFIYLA